MVIVDTGFWLALGNERDRHYAVAKEALRQLDEVLVTTWPVLTETCHLLLTRIGPHAQKAFIDSVAGGACELFPLDQRHTPRISVLMETYADLPMDLADASLVILAEELGHGRILSTDHRDFGAYRWKNHAPFENLLLR